MRIYNEAADRISIHAPHARSDMSYPMVYLDHNQISIHAPHARSDDNG